MSYMSFEMRIADQKKALGYLKQELGEDNFCYRDLKADFLHLMIFTFGSMIADTALIVGAVAFYGFKYGIIDPFTTFVFLFVFMSISMACAVFADSLNVGFWKWNRYYYRLWLKYDREIPLEVLTEFSNNYLNEK